MVTKTKQQLKYTLKNWDKDNGIHNTYMKSSPMPTRNEMKSYVINHNTLSACMICLVDTHSWLDQCRNWEPVVVAVAAYQTDNCWILFSAACSPSYGCTKFKRIDDAIKFVIRRLNAVQSTKHTINTHTHTKWRKTKGLKWREVKRRKKKLDPNGENKATYWVHCNRNSKYFPPMDSLQ